MYQISVITYNGKEVIKRVIEKELAILYFKAFTSAEDTKEVMMIDGLTGEILFDYTTKDGWEIFDGTHIDF